MPNDLRLIVVDFISNSFRIQLKTWRSAGTCKKKVYAAIYSCQYAKSNANYYENYKIFLPSSL